jgi:hypothetical protein
VPFSTLALLTMVLYLDFPNALYSPPDDERDLDEVDSASFLAGNDGMDEEEGPGHKCSGSSTYTLSPTYRWCHTWNILLRGISFKGLEMKCNVAGLFADHCVIATTINDVVSLPITFKGSTPVVVAS